MSGILQTLFLGAAAAVKDAYFNLVTLLLNTTATNGAQNNTFLDSSTNNFSITRNGNTTQGTFTPFSQTGWSMYLNGSSYVQTPSGSLTNLTGGQLTTSQVFTVEAFINIPESMLIAGDVNPGGGGNAYAMNIDSSGYPTFGWWNGSSYTTRTGNVAIQFNKWNHVAWVINAGTVYFYVNGSAASSNSIGNSAETYGALTFGGYNNSFKPGYYSNLRVTKSVVYSGAYTVPTTQLNALAGTTLLTFQTNRFKDNSASNYTLTLSGTPSVQAFSPFAPAYITPTTYSNWFNGSNGYLTIGTGVAFGSGAYTIECWFNANAFGSFYTIIGNGGSNALTLSVDSATAVKIDQTNVGSTTFTVASMALNTWHHLVVVRNSSNATTVFVDGVRSTTGAVTLSNNFSVTTKAIGFTSGGGYWNGCISNLRCVVGTAVYDPTQSTITVPTAPLTAISGTQLLTCQNSTFIDNSTNNYSLTLTGNVQPVASPTPFAPTVETEAAAYSTTLVGGSGYFDGSGDYLAGTGNTTNSNVALTIEAWVYFTGSTASRSIFSNMSVSGGTSGVSLATTPSGYITFGRGNGGAGTGVTSSTPTYVNTWYHFAVSRTSGGAITLFQNGAIVATGSDASLTDRTSFVIGGAYTDLAVNNPQGYIASLRVTTGGALYASAFAPSFAPFTTTVSSGTVTLLTNFTNAGIYDSTAKNDLETVGNAQVSTTQAKWGTTSMYFDGTGYLKPSGNNQGYVFGTGNFTVEMWVYLTGYGTNTRLYDGRPAANGAYLTIQINTGAFSGTTNALQIYVNSNVQIDAGSAAPLNTWFHLAICRSGTSTKMFVNGTQVGLTYTDSTNYLGGNAVPTIGASEDGANKMLGYIDDLRISKYARYTTTFTPPTTAFPIQ